jgi:hypothetical protein
VAVLSICYYFNAVNAIWVAWFTGIEGKEARMNLSDRFKILKRYLNNDRYIFRTELALTRIFFMLFIISMIVVIYLTL